MARGPITVESLARDLHDAWPAITGPDPVALEQHLLCRLEAVQHAAAELRRQHPMMVAELGVAGLQLVRQSVAMIETWELADPRTVNFLKMHVKGCSLAAAARALGCSREHLSRCVAPKALQLLATIVLRLARVNQMEMVAAAAAAPAEAAVQTV
jgi:hypothetical protein